MPTRIAVHDLICVVGQLLREAIPYIAVCILNLNKRPLLVGAAFESRDPSSEGVVKHVVGHGGNVNSVTD